MKFHSLQFVAALSLSLIYACIGKPLGKSDKVPPGMILSEVRNPKIVEVGPKGMWIIGEKGDVFYRNRGGNLDIPSTLMDKYTSGFGGAKPLWLTLPSESPRTIEILGSFMSDIAVGIESVWAINFLRTKIYIRDMRGEAEQFPMGYSWKEINLPSAADSIIDIAIEESRDEAWILTDKMQLYRRSGASKSVPEGTIWEVVEVPPLVSIAAGPNGLLGIGEMKDRIRNVYHIAARPDSKEVTYDKSDSGDFQQLSIGKDIICGIESTGKLFCRGFADYYNLGIRWRPELTDSKWRHVSLDPSGRFALISSKHKLYFYDNE